MIELNELRKIREVTLKKNSSKKNLSNEISEEFSNIKDELKQVKAELEKAINF